MFMFYLVKPLVLLLYPTKVGRVGEMADGAAIVCANHSTYIDPLLVGIALGIRKVFLRFMVKQELVKVPVLGAFLLSVGCFPVDRSYGIDAVRTSMRLLRAGETVMMFPEGTRVSTDDAVAAKDGAVRLAMRMGVPLVPIYISRNKRVFRRVKLVVGEPYIIEKQEKPDYDALSNELMEKIRMLGSEM